MTRIRRTCRKIAVATKAKTFSLPSTAAAWTIAEIGRAVNDANILGIPSKSSAKVFLTVFGIALVGQIAVACRGEVTEEAEHTEPHHTAVVATLSREEEEAKNVRSALVGYTATIAD